MNDKQDILGRCLRQEAESQSPAFSEHLHQRIMSDIKFAPAGLRPSNGLSRKAVIPWLGVAAAAAAFLIFANFRSRPATPHKVVAIQMLPSLPPVGRVLADTAAPIDEDLNAARFGYLDRDARRFAHFIADQFDVLPDARGGTGHPSAKVQG